MAESVKNYLIDDSIQLTENRLPKTVECCINNLSNKDFENTYVLCAVHHWNDAESNEVNKDFSPIFGGKVNIGESNIMAANREVREEAGITGSFTKLPNCHFIDTGYKQMKCSMTCYNLDITKSKFIGFQDLEANERFKTVFSKEENRRLRAKVGVLIHGSYDQIKAMIDKIRNYMESHQSNDGINEFRMIKLNDLNSLY
jgi:hypothetical protein